MHLRAFVVLPSPSPRSLCWSAAGSLPDAEVADQVDPTEVTAEEVVIDPVADDYVILYSGRNESLVQPLIDRFTEQTGITVDIRYAGSSELAAQLLEEGADSPASVFLSQDAGALGALSLEGLFAELPADITGRVNPAFTSYDDSWVGITGRARVIVYDSETLTAEELPSTADEIVAPSGQERWELRRVTRASNRSLPLIASSEVKGPPTSGCPA